MRNQRGLRRLAIALGIPYFGFWALYGLGGWRIYRRNSAELSSNAESSFHDTIILAHQSGEGLHRVDAAFTWGVVVPVIVLFILLVLRWVFRGFRADCSDHSTKTASSASPLICPVGGKAFQNPPLKLQAQPASGPA